MVQATPAVVIEIIFHSIAVAASTTVIGQSQSTTGLFFLTFFYRFEPFVRFITVTGLSSSFGFS